MVLFRELPLDLRSRAACVCRAWRDAAADPTMWVKISVGDESGVEREVPPGLLVALCRRGGRNVEALCVSGCSALDVRALLAAAAECKNLKEIRAATLGPEGGVKWTWPEIQQVRSLARPLARLLATLVATLYCTRTARGLLRAGLRKGIRRLA
jgi:hypothetical protein